MNMRQVYKKIAKENGISIAEVKREMQKAIEEAYKNPCGDAPNDVPCKGDIPTPDEFIKHAVLKITQKTE